MLPAAAACHQLLGSSAAAAAAAAATRPRLAAWLGSISISSCVTTTSRRGFAAEAGGEGGGGGSAVRELKSAADYDAVMKGLAESGSLGIIDFTAKWCGPCKAIAPIYEQLSQQFPSVAFLKIDIDNADMQPVVNDHAITGVPTFTVYKGARKVEAFTGARVDLLRAVLKKHAA